MATKAELIQLLVDIRPELNDQLALKYSSMYPVWKDGITVEIGQRYQYGDRLYKVGQPHTTQSDWTPDITPSLWTVIDVTHAGTIDNPIPAVSGMEYTKGLYYIENDVIYLMNRSGMNDGETVVLYYTPSQLVGQYFEVIN